MTTIVQQKQNCSNS